MFCPLSCAKTGQKAPAGLPAGDLRLQFLHMALAYSERPLRGLELKAECLILVDNGFFYFPRLLFPQQLAYQRQGKWNCGAHTFPRDHIV